MSALAAPAAQPGLVLRLAAGNALPVALVLVVMVVLWYGFAVWLNMPWQLSVYERAGQAWTFADLVRDTLNQERPVLPGPHQVFAEIWRTTVEVAPTSRRSLLYHAWITLSSTLLGFVLGALLGIVLAVFIVHNKAMDKSVMPWVVASQTIPISPSRR
jgi:NitT/TauT family transport system permease protein